MMWMSAETVFGTVKDGVGVWTASFSGALYLRRMAGSPFGLRKVSTTPELF